MHRPIVTNNHQPARGGVTLTEVLISLLAMGVGVVTVATMFPVSVLKSVKATQLTQSTILRYNAEEILEIDQQLLFNPDDDTMTGHLGENFVVDPLGHAVHLADGTGLENRFGNGGPGTAIRRYRARYTTKQAAEATFASRDSWEDFNTADFIFTDPVNEIQNDTPNTNEIQVTVPAEFDGLTLQQTLGSAEPAAVRMLLIRNDNRRAEVRTVVNMPDNLTLEAAGNIPNRGEIERLRVQIQRVRFSWLLTVRLDSSGAASTDVVVFYNRGFEPRNETRYDAVFTLNDTEVTIDGYTASNKPFLKKGGYLFDAQNAIWYRIEDFTETDTSATITIDRGATAVGNVAMAMKGVVDVFHLGIKVP